MRQRGNVNAHCSNGPTLSLFSWPIDAGRSKQLAVVQVRFSLGTLYARSWGMSGPCVTAGRSW
jgi:hypothetical protein